MRFIARCGRIAVTMRIFRQGRDVQVLFSGGQSHIGAVALAAPTPQGPQTQLLALPGHREDDLAVCAAKRLAAVLDCAVCVSAGIHYDNITREEIHQVETMIHALTERCVAALTKDTPC